MTLLKDSLKNLGKTFKLQKELLKTEVNHDEINDDYLRDKKDEWVYYVGNVVLCTAFSYALYTKALEEITGFGMKNCLSLPGLRWKNFISLRTEDDEPINTYNNKYMRWFVRKIIRGGRVCAFNQFYTSKICDDILKIISEGINVKGKIYDKIEAYLEYENKRLKNLKKNMKVNLTIIETRMKKKEKKLSLKN